MSNKIKTIFYAALLALLSFSFIQSLPLNKRVSAQEKSIAADDDTTNTDTILLVGNKGEDSVSFIDLKSGREIGRRPSGKNPHEIALSPDKKRVAIVSYGESNIDIFDIETRTLVKKIDISPNSNPHGLVWLADDRIIATTEGSDTITMISAPQNGKHIITSIATGQKGSHMLAVDRDGRFAYVANLQSASVTKVDLIQGKKITDVATGAGTEGIALTADGKELYVSARGDNSVIVLDAATMEIMQRIAVGRFPLRVIISPDGKYAVTSNLQDGSLSVINIATRKVERTIIVSGNADTQQVTILFSDDGKYIYVAETGINRIAEIDFERGKLIGRLAAGKNGDGLAIAPK